MQHGIRNLKNQDGARKHGSALMTAAAITWVVLGMAGMLAISGVAALWLLAVCWGAYALGSAILLARVAGEAGCGAAVGVVGIAAVAVNLIGADAREDLILHSRGHEVTAVVVSERVETGSRGGKTWYYSLQHADGTAVPGPTLRDSNRSYRVGDRVNVFEDPDGAVDPRTPHRADPTREFGGLVALGMCSIALVFFARYRARSRKAEGITPTPGTIREEAQFRELLRTAQADRRGYIKIAPDRFPDLTQTRAAVLAREEGLKAEAFGNRGHWRFAPEVVEEITVQE